MNYELVKQLKDAGYPFPHPIDGDEFWRTPTLEELIEACGEDFFALALTSDGWMAQAKFRGTSRNFVDYLTTKTPTEAVAKLWLALHGKSL